MKKVLILAAITACTVCCKPEEIDITGTWCHSRPGWGESLIFRPDGTATSVNLDNIMLEKWRRNGDTLFITGIRIGRPISIRITDTVLIDKRSTNDSLFLRQGDIMIGYGRVVQQQPTAEQ